MAIQQDFRVKKGLFVSEKADVVGNTAVGGALSVINSTSLANTLSVSGAATLASTLTVAGLATLSANANIAGSANVGGSLTVAGAVTFSDTVGVTAALTLSNTVVITGAAALSNTLSVTGATTLSSTLGVTGAATVSNTLSVLRGATLSNTIAVTGAATLSNTLIVTGATTLSSTLGVTGVATFSNNASVAGNTTLSRNLSVIGSTALSNTLGVAGATTLSSTLDVTGAASLSNTLSVGGVASFISNVAITGDLTVGGNKVWHAGNDGTTSGLDADLLDGWHRDEIRAWANITGKPFSYTSQAGQPTGVWGTNDGVTYYVWNPSDFSVSQSNTAQQLSATRTNWTGFNVANNVVGQLAWRNFGNNHTIFDASAGLSPDGAVINPNNPTSSWAQTYPTLMGWNGTSTYGVRVDSARLADSAGTLTTWPDTRYSNTSFNVIAVSGQPNVVADSIGDTLTLVAGNGMSITTDASTDTITISALAQAGYSLQVSANTIGNQGIIQLTSSSGNTQAIIAGGGSVELSSNATHVLVTGRLIDSVSNTSISTAATANSVKTAYDLAVAANTNAGTAYSNAVSVAATDASTKAATAFSNAVSYADTSKLPKINPTVDGKLNLANGSVVIGTSLTFADANGTAACTLTNTGNLTATGAVTAYSDARLKDNIRTIEKALETVCQLRGVAFTKDGVPSVGVVAQEVEQFVPEVVIDNIDGFKSVAYGNLVGLLIEAIKQQQHQIDELKTILAGR